MACNACLYYKIEALITDVLPIIVKRSFNYDGVPDKTREEAIKIMNEKCPECDK